MDSAKQQGLPQISVASLLDPRIGLHDPQFASTAKQIGEACRTIGFFIIHDHGLSSEYMDNVYLQAKRFFQLSEAKKKEVAISKAPEAHRGYFGFLEENTDEVRGKGDMKEGFDFGIQVAEHEEERPLCGRNQWPKEADLPNFKETMLKYYGRLRIVGNGLLRAFAADLGQPVDFFVPAFSPGLHVVRILHYPSQDPERLDPSIIGCGAHSDYGCVTLLSTISPGLEVKTAKGEWIKAPHGKDFLLVNLGDMMERWTNGMYKATLHRVVNTTGSPRYSIPFFFEPNYETKVTTLDSCIDEAHPKQYDDTVYGEHLTKRLDATFSFRQKED